jgi:hypothetical protein
VRRLLAGTWLKLSIPDFFSVTASNPDAKIPRFMGELLEPVIIIAKEGQSETERRDAEKLGQEDIDAPQGYWGLIGGNRPQNF